MTAPCFFNKRKYLSNSENKKASTVQNEQWMPADDIFKKYIRNYEQRTRRLLE